jgi:hypothetical protein
LPPSSRLVWPRRARRGPGHPSPFGGRRHDSSSQVGCQFDVLPSSSRSLSATGHRRHRWACDVAVVRHGCALTLGVEPASTGRPCSRCNQHSRQGAACTHHSQSWSRRDTPGSTMAVGALPRSVTRSSVSPERALEGFARAAARRAMTGQKRRLASCGCCRATGFRSLREEPFGSMGRRRSARSLRRERRQTHEALTPIDSDGGVVAGASDGQHGMFR